ncbi:MAG: hypothetical protein WCS73_10385, partial [Lentisphaeria bacterium]
CLILVNAFCAANLVTYLWVCSSLSAPKSNHDFFGKLSSYFFTAPKKRRTKVRLLLFGSKS